MTGDHFVLPPYIHNGIDAIRYLVDWLLAWIALHGPGGDAFEPWTRN